MLTWQETDEGRCFFADSAYTDREWEGEDGETREFVWQLDKSVEDDPADEVWLVIETSPTLTGADPPEWKTIDEAQAWCQGREDALLAKVKAREVQ